MFRKSKSLLASVALSLALLPGCIGTFQLTHEVWARNEKIENKIGRECLFLGLLIVPVYEVAVLADMLIFNTAELFSDETLWSSQGGEPRTDVEP
ncbi:MAG TPA: DUF3332 family protein [Planctomycetota bacterium]|nr:DUF3332 family protein [Planctomycetota bacterium]